MPQQALCLPAHVGDDFFVMHREHDPGHYGVPVPHQAIVGGVIPAEFRQVV